MKFPTYIPHRELKKTAQLPDGKTVQERLQCGGVVEDHEKVNVNSLLFRRLSRKAMVKAWLATSASYRERFLEDYHKAFVAVKHARDNAGKRDRDGVVSRPRKELIARLNAQVGFMTDMYVWLSWADKWYAESKIGEEQGEKLEKKKKQRKKEVIKRILDPVENWENLDAAFLALPLDVGQEILEIWQAEIMQAESNITQAEVSRLPLRAKWYTKAADFYYACMLYFDEGVYGTQSELTMQDKAIHAAIYGGAEHLIKDPRTDCKDPATESGQLAEKPSQNRKQTSEKLALPSTPYQFPDEGYPI